MSSLLNAVRQFQYIGAPQAMPTALCTPPTQKPMNVPITIDWTIYFTAAGNSPATLGVSVDLSGTSPNAAKLDAIRSVKIDNTASYCTIYVWFTDTNDVVTCAPQTVTTMPVNTNQQKFVVIASGLATGFLPLTNVYLYNVQLPPSVDPALQLVYPQEIGSPTVQLNSTQILTPGFGGRALGDQSDQAILPLQVDGTSVNIMNTPQTVNFLYLTHIQINQVQCSNAASRYLTLFVESTGAAGILFSVDFAVGNNNFVNQGILPMLNLNGMNLKLDAKQTWRFRFTIVAGGGLTLGSAEIVLVFSANNQ